MNLNKLFLNGLVLFAFAVLISCSGNTSSGIDPEKTKAVVQHHWETFAANDLEGVMEDYTEESIIITPTATHRGLEEIRQNFVNAFKVFPSGEADLTLNKTIIEGDIGYILWEATAPDVHLRFGTDTFIVRNGKIVKQTYGGISQSQLEN